MLSDGISNKVPMDMVEVPMMKSALDPTVVMRPVLAKPSVPSAPKP